MDQILWYGVLPGVGFAITYALLVTIRFASGTLFDGGFLGSLVLLGLCIYALFVLFYFFDDLTIFFFLFISFSSVILPGAYFGGLLGRKIYSNWQKKG